jgi:DNA-binding NarL/FixJ family response regulator
MRRDITELSSKKSMDSPLLAASRPVRILVVDDHGIVRDGLTLLLNRQEHMEVIGTATTGKEAIAAAMRLKPEVVVMDLMLPELSGVDATARILSLLPQTRVVVLSVSHTSEHVFRALRAGAQGYVVKEAAGVELVHAIATVSVGERYLSPRITELLIRGILDDSAGPSPLERLSAREREVLHLTVAGSTSAEIAEHLSLSRRTVDTYRSRLMEKLGVQDLTNLIRFAIEHALAPT